MPFQPSTLRKFTLSRHARVRLSERASLSDESLLSLLDRRVYKRVFTEFYRNLTKEDIAYFGDSHGLTPKELREYGLLDQFSTVEHLLVWSQAEQQFLLCIATSTTGYVLTVLHEQYLQDRFANGRISEKHREIAKSRFEQITRSSEPASGKEIAVRWTTAEGIYRAKVFSPARLGIPPAVSWKEEQILASLGEVLEGASDISIIVRPRGRPDLVDYEYSGTSHS
jgi:hypothetical protein